MSNVQTPADAEKQKALTALATQINIEWTMMVKDAEKIVHRAITFGKLLNDAKDKAGHGNWLTWHKENCKEISERTARRYMTLADGEEKLKAKMTTKSVTMADLTINDALALIEEPAVGTDASGNTGNAGAANTGNTGNSSTSNPSSDTIFDKLDKKMDNVIKALNKLKKEKGVETAIEEIEKLQETLNDKMAILALEKEEEIKKAAKKQKGRTAVEHATA